MWTMDESNDLNRERRFVYRMVVSTLGQIGNEVGVVRQVSTSVSPSPPAGERLDVGRTTSATFAMSRQICESRLSHVQECSMVH
jgi:hypothetical protein